MHGARWSGAHPENSLAAIAECVRERVARMEIDIRMREGTDFLVAHDEDEPGAPLLSDATALLRGAGPTLVELDVKDFVPWPRPRVEELAHILEPVRDRVVACGQSDWNLRRLLAVDPRVPVGFDPARYIDWTPEGGREEMPGPRGAYGYFDAHPLARRRTGTAAEYLRDRLGGIVGLVPGAREIHLRLAFFERMLEDGLDVSAFLHASGLLVDVWTLDAGTERWRERLARAVAAGADMVTTNTPRELAAALASGA